MPSLSEKLAEFEKIKAEFDEALRDLKAQNSEQISDEVQSVAESKASEIQKLLKSELSQELSVNLNEKSELIHTTLKEFAKDEASKNALQMLDDKAFLQKLDELALNAANDKIEQKLEHFEMLVLQFKNATSCFKLCLANELFIMSEVLKNIAQIEFYESSIEQSKPIFKAFKVV